MIRVLVADNSRIHTCLLAQALARDPALDVIPFESDAAGLVDKVVAENIAVLVLSSELDDQPCRGFEVLQELRALRPDVRTVLLPSSSKDETILQAFRAGASGVFDRADPLELLSKCVRCVHEGQIWANSRNLSIAIRALVNGPVVRAVNAAGMSLLSERELEVVRFLVEGLSNREIGERMRLSQHTVKNHLFRVFEKLGVSSRTELVFMTLSQASGPHSSPPALAKDDGNGNGYSSDESDLLKKSAESGLPAAQLALAQLYLNRRNEPEDLIEAYKWYLVATERALQARASITKMMTPQQIEEAGHRASVWLSKWKRPSLSLANLSSEDERADGAVGGLGNRN